VIRHIVIKKSQESRVLILKLTQTVFLKKIFEIYLQKGKINFWRISAIYLIMFV